MVCDIKVCDVANAESVCNILGSNCFTAYSAQVDDYVCHNFCNSDSGKVCTLNNNVPSCEIPEPEIPEPDWKSDSTLVYGLDEDMRSDNWWSGARNGGDINIEWNADNEAWRIFSNSNGGWQIIGWENMDFRNTRFMFTFDVQWLSQRNTNSDKSDDGIQMPCPHGPHYDNWFHDQHMGSFKNYKIEGTFGDCAGWIVFDCDGGTCDFLMKDFRLYIEQ